MTNKHLSRTKLYYQRVIRFIQHDIWIIEEETPTLPHRLKRLLRIILLASRGFTRNSVQLRATALTYYTMMSMVPIVAMAFAIAKGFGLEERLTLIIHERLDSYPEVSDKLVEFSSALLERTGAGLIAQGLQQHREIVQRNMACNRLA